jgi:hypothetical protein
MRKEKWPGGFAAGITLIPGRSGPKGKWFDAGLVRIPHVRPPDPARHLTPPAKIGDGPDGRGRADLGPAVIARMLSGC